MSIEVLTIIGESINDSVPSTHQLFEDSNIEGILELAKYQDEKGAKYIDVNIGLREPGFMADLVKKIQKVTSKPLSIDTPDIEIAAAGLEAYQPELANHQKPILNSISRLRLNMFDLYKNQPFIPILLTTEDVNENGESVMNHTAEATYNTAKKMMKIAEQSMDDFSNDQCILDPGIVPIGSDSEGYFKRLMESAARIHSDPDLAGVNMSVGLSNFTVMLPPKCADGSPVKSALESAFLTMAMPLGLNMVIGSVKRKYRILEESHPAMQCLSDILQLDGFDVIVRVMEFYS
ncbi:dihydropteroate synthase [bacterium]|nr:dihydropteroate synthase [bacterium]